MRIVSLEEINRIQKENAELRAQNKALTDKEKHL
jgi:hypothetical protein